MACALNKEQISDVFKLIYFKVKNDTNAVKVEDLIKFFL